MICSEFENRFDPVAGENMRGDILNDLNEHLNRLEPVVLVSVVETRGSTPRKAGSQMLVFEDGSIKGTIGGGQGEARSIDLAAVAFVEKTSSLHRLTMNASVAAAEGMACGGDMLIFVQYVDADDRRVS